MHADGEANAPAPLVFLHQSQDKRAGLLSVARLAVHLRQNQEELRVLPEQTWRNKQPLRTAPLRRLYSRAPNPGLQDPPQHLFSTPALPASSPLITWITCVQATRRRRHLCSRNLGKYKCNTGRVVEHKNRGWAATQIHKLTTLEMKHTKRLNGENGAF